MKAYARQPRYRVYRDFLPARARLGLLTWAGDNEADFKPTGVSSGRTDRRKSLRIALPAAMADLLRRHMLDLFPAVTGDLGLEVFEPSTVQTELVAHNDGAFFKRHSDRFYGLEPGADDRILTAVYYFYDEPKQFSGGALRLYASESDEEDCESVDILPEQNTLLVFPSSSSHEVLPVSCPSGRVSDSRFAVNFWVCRRVGEPSGEVVSSASQARP